MAVPEGIAKLPEQAPPADSLTTLLSPIDSKFYSVPTSRVNEYLKAGYATPIGRDISRQRILNGYNTWQKNLEAIGAAAVSDIPFANTAITSVLNTDTAKAYAQETANLQEASPVLTGVTKVGAPVAAITAAALTGGASAVAEGAAAAGEAAAGEGAAGAAGAATEGAGATAAKTLGQRAAAYAPEVAKSAAINAGIGTAGRMDEAAIQHALDPEGQEKFQFELGPVLFDAALGGAAHIGLGAVGKTFKGIGHGIDYVGEKIRGSTAAAAEAAATGGEAAAGEASTFGDIASEQAAAGEAPTPGAPLGDKPLSAAAQRLADLKAEAAAAAEAPLGEGETPTARAKASADFKERIATLESMTPEEIVQAHTDPQVVAKADAHAAADPFENDIFAGQEHGEDAKDRLREHAELDAATIRKRFKAAEVDHNEEFNNIEGQQRQRGGALPQPVAQRMLKELRERFGNLPIHDKVYGAFAREITGDELDAVLSPTVGGVAKTAEELDYDRDYLRYPGARSNIDLRTHQNAIRALDKSIGHDSIETTPHKEDLLAMRQHLSSYLDEHFHDVRPGDATAEDFRALQKKYSVNKLAQQAVSQADALKAGDPYRFVNERAQKAQGKLLDALKAKSANADVQLQRETERFARAKAAAEKATADRTTKAEQAVAREEYAKAERAQKEAARESERVKKEADKAAKQQSKNNERIERDKARQAKFDQIKAERAQAKTDRDAALKEAKFGNVVKGAIAGAMTHGLKGSLTGGLTVAAFQLLKGIPATQWVRVAESLSTIFKGVDSKLATAVEAGLFGLPADMHRALDPQDYNRVAAKVMAARNGPENAYKNLAEAALAHDVPDVVVTPLVQNQWSALQELGKQAPSTAGAPGVYSEDEPDIGQKLVWLGQVQTTIDPTYGIANPTPENISILKASYPQMLYNSQQAALLEVQQNPDVSLEGKLWASALCERPLTALASSQFLSVLAGARQQSENAQKAQMSSSAGSGGNQKVQSSMSRMDSLQNQDA